VATTVGNVLRFVSFIIQLLLSALATLCFSALSVSVNAISKLSQARALYSINAYGV
jgi:hypothetical protein